LVPRAGGDFRIGVRSKLVDGGVMRMRLSRTDFRVGGPIALALRTDEAGDKVLNPNASLGDIQNEPKGVAIAEINGLRFMSRKSHTHCQI
jgi:hypothetical protein